MNLLKLEGESDLKAYPDPNILQIQEFQKVADEEDLPAKAFAYIYHMNNPVSTFFTYDREERKKEVIESLFGDFDAWEPTEAVEEAEEKYVELIETPAMKLVRSGKKSIRKLEEYFRQADPMTADNPDRSAKNLMNNLSDIGDTVEGLNDLEDKIQERREGSDEIRGGKKVNEFSR